MLPVRFVDSENRRFVAAFDITHFDPRTRELTATPQRSAKSDGVLTTEALGDMLASRKCTLREIGKQEALARSVRLSTENGVPVLRAALSAGAANTLLKLGDETLKAIGLIGEATSTTLKIDGSREIGRANLLGLHLTDTVLMGSNLGKGDLLKAMLSPTQVSPQHAINKFQASVFALQREQSRQDKAPGAGLREIPEAVGDYLLTLSGEAARYASNIVELFRRGWRSDRRPKRPPTSDLPSWRALEIERTMGQLLSGRSQEKRPLSWSNTG